MKKKESDWADLYGSEGAQKIRALKKGESAEVRSKRSGNIMRITCKIPARAYEIKLQERNPIWVAE